MAYIITVIFLVCVTSLVRVKGHARPDRIEFMGTRGKRSLDEGNGVIPPTIESITSNIIQNGTEYRHVPDYIRRLPELSLFKRAPVGFMGMRGKKEFEYPDYSRRVTRENPGTFRGRKFQGQNRGLMNPNSKRAPSGFMGMRGKKLIDNNLLENKRVPSGFFGMRGKKDLNDLDQYKDEDNMDLFEDLQNERILLNDLNQLYDLDQGSDYNYYNKRAPASGFFGMRGKKFYDYNENYDDDDNSEARFDKRAPKGFLGMRGKRPYYDDEYDNIEEEKREPKGFMGMRGKKDDSQQYIEKRSSLAQFFGIRGKKQPLHSGFFGMRGKKQPFEFRGKFVGVRGKKFPEGSLRRLEFELNDIPNNELSSTLNDDTIMKRAPSGFMGMRGKKWPETITLDE